MLGLAVGFLAAGAPLPARHNATHANATFHSRNLPIGISQGLVCEGLTSEVEWTLDDDFRYVARCVLVLDACGW
jgi:hypothetical protein